MKNLAVFPLPVVLLPGSSLPLRIFETRYLDMVAACLRNQESFVVTPILKEYQSVNSIGTAAKITGWNNEESGILHILVKGIEKVNILNPKQDTNGLIIGQIEVKKDGDSEPDPRFYLLLDQNDSGPIESNSINQTLKTSAISTAYRIAEQNNLTVMEKFIILSEETGARKLEALEKILRNKKIPNSPKTLH